jgi:hypothetical protein
MITQFKRFLLIRNSPSFLSMDCRRANRPTNLWITKCVTYISSFCLSPFFPFPIPHPFLAFPIRSLGNSWVVCGSAVSSARGAQSTAPAQRIFTRLSAKDGSSFDDFYQRIKSVSFQFILFSTDLPISNHTLDPSNPSHGYHSWNGKELMEK